MDYKEIYESWLSNPYFDEETKAELKAIADDDNEIKERFYQDLEFGTAGLRGVIGAGTNRMNIYTVRKATQGLANYIIKAGKQSQGVAIAYDSRHMSPEFADEAALCLAANGIKAYVFESLRPTPELSYAVRELKCVAGINVTASHNPPEYNGYKVYWEDGAQITPPHDTGIMDEVKAVTDYNTVKTMAKEDAVKQGLYQQIGKDIDDKYIEELKKQVIHWDSIKEMGDKLKIVYTPLHGTGNIPARRVLEELGFKNVYVVPEQELPDGDFPTVSYPNPEAAEAFELGTFIMGFGAPREENVWKIDDDGTWLFDDEIMNVDTKDTTYHTVKNHYACEYWVAICGQWLKSDGRSVFEKIDPRVDRVSIYDYWPVNEDGSFADEGINICWGNYTAPAKDTTMYQTTFNSRDTIATIKQMVDDTITSSWAEIINSASEEDCIAAFEAARDNCNAMGLEELTDYYENSYKANVEKYEG